MKFQLLVEYQEERALYAGSVPGLNIQVLSHSEEEAFRLLREAIPLHLAMLKEAGQTVQPGRAKLITVDVDSPLLPGEKRRPKPRRNPDSSRLREQ